MADYTPSWFKPFQWDIYLQRYTSFPTLVQQWENDGNDNDGGWAGNWLYQVNDCVAMALSIAMQILNYKATGRQDRYSYMWIYGNRLSTDLQGTGMNTTQALNSLVRDGVPFYQSLPRQLEYASVVSNVTTVQAQIGTNTAKQAVVNYKPSLYTEASRNKLSSYLTYLPNQVSDATLQSYIQSDGCIIFDISPYDDVVDVEMTDGIVKTSNSVSQGGNMGHTMCVIGWKNINGVNYWMCLNSWGPSGSNQWGIYYVPFGHPRITYYYRLFPNITNYNPRPANWAWSYNIASGQPFLKYTQQDSKNYAAYLMNASEWNSFTKRLNDFRRYMGKQTFTFYDTVKSEVNVGREMINQANRYLADLGLTLYTALSGANIQAQTFLDLRDKMNSIP